MPNHDPRFELTVHLKAACSLNQREIPARHFTHVTTATHYIMQIQELNENDGLRT